ncbi:MAG: hypothetical protein ACEPOV_05675 [Hyphomicrobiales bacterium]
MIEKNMKMADVIYLDYHLLPLINRFGIQLGFGDATVEDVCQRNGVNVDFFVEIMNAFYNKSYFPKRKLQAFPVDLIVDYLKKTHQYYITVKVPEIEALVVKMAEESSLEKEIQLALIKFYSDYKKELFAHIEREEEQIYPYVQKLNRTIKLDNVEQEEVKELLCYSILKYREEHDDIEEKLFDLKNIIIKYLPPQKDYNLCNNILMELFDLEKDLNDHSRIEDLIMVPMVAQMEQELREKHKINPSSYE